MEFCFCCCQNLGIFYGLWQILKKYWPYVSQHLMSIQNFCSHLRNIKHWTFILWWEIKIKPDTLLFESPAFMLTKVTNWPLYTRSPKKAKEVYYNLQYNKYDIFNIDFTIYDTDLSTRCITILEAFVTLIHCSLTSISCTGYYS